MSPDRVDKIVRVLFGDECITGEERTAFIDVSREQLSTFADQFAHWITVLLNQQRLIELEGTVNLSATLAKKAILDLCFEKDLAPSCSGSMLVQESFKIPEWSQNIYNALLQLDRRSALPFKLQSIAEEALTSMVLDLNTVITPGLTVLLDHLFSDFPGLEVPSPLFTRVTFFKAERKPTDDLNEIKALMQGHQVTTQDVKSACMRNQCRTTIPIRFALKFIDGFKLQPFIKELVDVILNQPYRGIMLRELDRFFAQTQASVNFRELLTSAVEKQGEAFSSHKHPKSC